MNPQQETGSRTKKDLRCITMEEAVVVALENGFKPFHGKQLHEWIWKKGLKHFEDATNLPSSFRAKLEEHYTLNKAIPERVAESRDGTVKYLFRLHDKNFIEGVLIPSGDRMTACISSQAGCALKCTFCATGLGGFFRDLTAGEIYDQVQEINNDAQKRYGHHLSNIVLMGMGEPLLNFDSVKQAVNMIISDEGMAMSARRITISSAGIPEGIERMAKELPSVHLAISLHTVNDYLRSNLMPVNKKYNLAELKKSLRDYHTITGNRFSIEYLMLRGVNDSQSAARELAVWCRSFPVKINLIPYNATGMEYKNSLSAEAFKKILEEKNMVVTIRRSRGEDIDAACGQLAGKEYDQSDI